MVLRSRIFLTVLSITPVILGLVFSPFLFSQTALAVQTSVQVTVTGPSVCGNGGAESGEDCDDPDIPSTCQALGYGEGGTLTCNADCTFNTSQCIPAPPAVGGGGGGFTPPSSILVLKGRTSPEAILTILKDGQIFIIGQKADALGNFEMRIFDISAGVHTFSFMAMDREGRESIAFSITFTLSEGMTTTISGILLPPTIELYKGSLIKGETAPQSEVSIHFTAEGKEEIIKKIKAKTDGTWSYELAEANPEEKTRYLIKVSAVSADGLVSIFSLSQNFYFEGVLAPVAPGVPEIPEVPEVPEIPKIPKIPADLNGDERVNLVDFSILLYWWGEYDIKVDLNKDGTVGLVDFSIMMYYWTG